MGATWDSLDAGRTKLALACPHMPTVAHGDIKNCSLGDIQSQECTVQCNEGFGTLEPKMRCIRGAWYTPECLAVGTMLRLVAKAPEFIKPYWVVLDAALYASEDCTDVLRMEGTAISSGEYVIK